MPIQLRHDIEVDKYFARLHVIFRNEEADFLFEKVSPYKVWKESIH